MESQIYQILSKKFGDKPFSQEEMETYLNGLIDPEQAITDEQWKALKGKLEWKHQSDLLGLSLQVYIDGPPVNKSQLYARACSGDTITVESWRQQWTDQYDFNRAHYDLGGLSAMNEYGKCAHKPVICVGAGPSLKKNIHVLASEGKDVCKVACLHTLAFLEDNGASADYYVNLDAGEITVSELYQGGKKDPEHYWELSKNRTLITATVGHPELHKKWRGKILFYNPPIPDPQLLNKIASTSGLGLYFNVGGNTLGAALYFAKAVLGANPIAFVGADFSFGYERRFHPFDSPYDAQCSGTIQVPDIFGVKVHTWPSYYNFKAWFDFIACGGKGDNPGTYVNCTEGGILGAYAEGNIRQIQQMPLAFFLLQYNMHKRMPEITKPGSGPQLLF